MAVVHEALLRWPWKEGNYTSPTRYYLTLIRRKVLVIGEVESSFGESRTHSPRGTN